MIKKPKVRGGVALKLDAADAEPQAIETLPAPEQVVIPLIHHDGVPAVPCVATGDLVACGQCIGKAAHHAAVPVHASVSGTVRSIVPWPFSVRRDAMSMVIENNGRDEFASPIPYDKPVEECTAGDLFRRIEQSGIIDTNVNAVPLLQKLEAAAGAKPDLLVVNALVTEPFADARLSIMHAYAEKIFTGIMLCMKITGAAKCRVAVNEKRPGAYKAFSSLALAQGGEQITIAALRPNYPFHHERLLARAFTGVTLRGSKSSLDAGCMVIGCEALAAVHDAVMEFRPCYERVVAVGGPAAAAPKTFRVRIGTPVQTLLAACETDVEACAKVVDGGPLSGNALQELSTPVLKTSSAIIALDKPSLFIESLPCMKCRRCHEVCPSGLEPARLVLAVQKRDIEAARACGIAACLECGCCSYVCPSRINLVHWLRYGKSLSRRSQSQASDNLGAAA
ncbi:MAG: RnfABCDGE type electron transport complex subunit C [Chitinispirillaceae bacterium]|nr:RnfABCDGE type electron transport complex subunit C [Chitinispirillaceae bacterium]